MFTKREHQILLLIARGYNTCVIAEKLFIAVDTVRTHRKNIRKKVRELETADVKLGTFALRYALSNAGIRQK